MVVAMKRVEVEANLQGARSPLSGIVNPFEHGRSLGVRV